MRDHPVSWNRVVGGGGENETKQFQTRLRILLYAGTAIDVYNNVIVVV